MDKNKIVEAIRTILANDLENANLHAFSPTARLNDDLYLDSVLVLQLLIHLEMQLGIDVPDDALSAEDFITVDSLCNFLLTRVHQQQTTNIATEQATNQTSEQTETDTTDEVFEDIKVHCFVSCLCESIKADERVDHRPFYFGVWDADIVVDNDYRINYHSAELNHDFFRYWYERLYGVYVKPWYQADKPKEENINTLLHLLDTKTSSQEIMVMIDMYLLPERENKFNQNPFPHYVLLENAILGKSVLKDSNNQEETLFMRDPDFRWEGEQNKAQVLAAIRSPAVAGGYLLENNEIRPSPAEAINDYFIACLKSDSNPMTDAVQRIIDAHFNEQNNVPLANLAHALDQLPVLAIRKYAYEHGIAFFLIALEDNFDDFENWCDRIEILVSSYKSIQFRAMKIASLAESQLDNTTVIKQLRTEIYQLLSEQNTREFEIKAHVNQLFKQWQQQVGLYKVPATEEAYS